MKQSYDDGSIVDLPYIDQGRDADRLARSILGQGLRFVLPREYEAAQVPSPRLLCWSAPFLQFGMSEIRRWEVVDGLPISNSLRQMRECLARAAPLAALVRLTYRPLILELNVRRVRGDLVGVTSCQRFSHFVELVQQPEYALELWRRYPLAGQRCADITRDWIANSYRLLTRYSEDVDDICGAFGHDSSVGIEAINTTAGDAHARGQAVTVIHKSDGSRLMYKPRSSVTDEIFCGLLQWLNKKGFRPKLAGVKTLDRGTHSWAEFIENHSTLPPGLKRSYYLRYGGILAALYVLNGTDIHRENLLRSGEHPFVIDVETVAYAQDVLECEHESSAESVGRAVAYATVLGTGALPTPRIIEDDGRVVLCDPSPLAATNRQLTPSEEPLFVNLDTDEMHVATRRMIIEPVTEQEDPGGHEGQINESDILAGFRAAYRIFQTQRNSLIVDTGFLSRLGQVRVRHLLGNTEMYGRILWNSEHPDLLSSHARRDAYLQRLADHNKRLARGKEVTASELRQLLAGDVPVFYAEPAGKRLYGADGAAIDHALEESGIQSIQDRVSRLSDIDLSHQMSVISGAVRCASLTEPTQAASDDPALCSSNKTWMLDTAVSIGDYLVETATWKAGRPYWLSYSLETEEHWLPGVAGADLYSGNSGIGVFLSWLAASTGRASYANVAESIARQTRAAALSDAPWRRGAPLGITSIQDSAVYLTGVRAAFTGDVGNLETIVDRLRRHYSVHLAASENNDVISGVAGTLLSLIAVRPLLTDHTTVDSLIRVGVGRLRQNMILGVRGAQWASSSGQPLWGMSHGSSGVVLALARASEIIPDACAEELVGLGQLAEHKAYDQSRCLWPDLRRRPDDSLVAWCHGAPGIALSRSALPPLFQTEATLVDISRGRSALLRLFERIGDIERRTGPFSLSLCHGAIGNLLIMDALIAGAEGCSGWEVVRDRVLSRIRYELSAHGWTFGAPKGLRTVDLMTGISGLGYGLLALNRRSSDAGLLAFTPLTSAGTRATSPPSNTEHLALGSDRSQSSPTR